jgi:hypothetical protein
MKVLCISAKAQHGKDTAAGFIKEYLESKGGKVLITHYADLVKFVCTKFFNWDGRKDEKGRTLLQYVGTDVISSQQPSYWVDFIVSILKFFENEWDYVLIPDCRYPIEVLKMRENFDTSIIRIERPNFDNGLTLKQKMHPSEIAMDNFSFDAVILNEGNLENFKKNLITYINKEFDTVLYNNSN